jgi:magnesium chelatase family protein
VYREKVEYAREVQRNRFKGSGEQISLNSEMSAKHINRYIKLSEECEDFLKNAASKLNLSGRAIHRILKTARTIADLEQESDITIDHISECLQMRIKV